MLVIPPVAQLDRPHVWNLRVGVRSHPDGTILLSKHRAGCHEEIHRNRSFFKSKSIASETRDDVLAALADQLSELLGYLVRLFDSLN